MKIIIIEDEKPSARRLTRMLSGLEKSVLATLHSVEESIEWFQQNEHPDLILLDIQLSDGLSFEIFEQVSVKSAIIFTTAYDEYALKAFKLNSIDYLLKPIDHEELENAIEKFEANQLKKQSLQVDLNEIRKLLVNPLERKFKERFTIKLGQHIKMIPVDDIECFYSENKGTYIATNSNRIFLMDGTLEEIDADVDPEKFFRVSRKFYVNINAIKDIVSYTNSRLQLILHSFSESEIIVSREKVKDFKKWIS
ncbi:LytTR family DNA-binding domain-containing protein [Flavicella sp.]|uniref:LytR/AlgR family response regulator transcription factor n=1 Tax=Flavicella sp. TaxID=2957742 RepID=UPI00260F796F|nr:LytTR family DNA-binding domain-containing protein [Flavicella sp.]MDG1805890.1 LytTR family DNA-binding domain-containing protein [Flavicella sp.]